MAKVQIIPKRPTDQPITVELCTVSYEIRGPEKTETVFWFAAGFEDIGKLTMLVSETVDIKVFNNDRLDWFIENHVVNTVARAYSKDYTVHVHTHRFED